MIGSPEFKTQDATHRSEELRLRVIGTEHDGRILRIQSAKCTIGSAQGCTLRLKAPGVAGVHCLVLRGPGGLAVRTWSKQTRLNGRAFVDAMLSPGDRLTVGPLEFEVLPTSDQTTPSPQLVQGPGEPLSGEVVARLAEREAHINQLNARLAEAERLVEVARKEATMTVPVAPAVDHSAEVLALRQQLETLKSEELARRAESAEIQQRLLAEREQVDALSAAIEQLRAESQTTAASWQQERERLNTELLRAKQQTHGALENQREHREMEVAITHWRERAEELTRQLTDAQRQLAEQSVAASGTDDPQALRAELEAGARELDAQAEQLLEQEESLQQRLQAWEAEKAQLESELSAQQQQLETLRISLAEREAALAAQEALLAKQEARLAEQESDLLEQQALFADAQEAFRREQEQVVASPVRYHDPLHEEEQPETDQPPVAEKEPYEPTSASDIIARLSASGLWKDDVPEEPAAETASAEPEPAWKSLVSEEERVPTPTAAAPVEEEDSIEAYMQRLLQRVSGDAEPSTPRVAASHAQLVAPRAESNIVEPTKTSPAETAEEPFDPSTYVPRSTAPELNSNLAAMRELANNSARSAIDSSSKRRQAKHAIGKVVMAMAAVGTALGLWWLSRQTHSVLSYYASLSAGAAALIWGLHAATLAIRSRLRAAEDTLDN